MAEVFALFADAPTQGEGSTVVVLRSSQNVETLLPALRRALSKDQPV
jgi:hypothetical protein